MGVICQKGLPFPRAGDVDQLDSSSCGKTRIAASSDFESKIRKMAFHLSTRQSEAVVGTPTF